MEELDHYRMRDGGILSLQNHGDGLKYVVAYYNRSDIEEWAQEFDSLEAAQRQFEYRRRTDKGPKTGDKR